MKFIKVLILSISIFITLSSCSKDDEITTVYGYTIDVHTDTTINQSREDVAKLVNLFVDKDWIVTKSFTSNTLDENDKLAKKLFQDIVEQANQEFSNPSMNLIGNTKLTYRCTRDSSSNEVEIIKQEWNYLKTQN